jgi:hypothetical protein
MRRRGERRKEIKEICTYTYAGGQGGLEYLAATNALFFPGEKPQRATQHAQISFSRGET